MSHLGRARKSNANPNPNTNPNGNKNGMRFSLLVSSSLFVVVVVAAACLPDWLTTDSLAVAVLIALFHGASPPSLFHFPLLPPFLSSLFHYISFPIPMRAHNTNTYTQADRHTHAQRLARVPASLTRRRTNAQTHSLAPYACLPLLPLTIHFPSDDG